MCLIEIVRTIGWGAKCYSTVSFRSSSEQLSTVRLVRGKIALTLAACLVCVAVNDGNAASNRAAEFATMPFIAPVSPVRIDGLSAGVIQRTFRQPANVNHPRKSCQPDELFPADADDDGKPAAPSEDRPRGQADCGNRVDVQSERSERSGLGDEKTASGERYDASGWTAAIRIDLRAKFGGVRFGKNYLPGFALVQSSDKQAIVRINDIGPLKRGRIIDLNERTMRYFDPALELGLIEKVRVTPLAGQDWALGPVDDDRPVSVASRFDQ